MVVEQLEQVDALHILLAGNLLDGAVEPASAVRIQRRVGDVTLTSLLCNQDHRSALCFSLLGHGGEGVVVCLLVGVVSVVDADGDEIVISRFDVFENGIKLPVVHKRFCILSAGRHVPNLVHIGVNEPGEDLPPASLCAGRQRVVVADGRIPTKPDGRFHRGIAGQLCDLQGTERVGISILPGGTVDIQLTVRNGDLEGIRCVVARQIHQLVYAFCSYTGAVCIAQSHRNLIQPVIQIYVKGVVRRNTGCYELNCIAQCAAAGCGNVFHISRCPEAITSLRRIAGGCIHSDVSVFRTACTKIKAVAAGRCGYGLAFTDVRQASQTGACHCCCRQHAHQAFQPELHNHSPLCRMHSNLL